MAVFINQNIMGEIEKNINLILILQSLIKLEAFDTIELLKGLIEGTPSFEKSYEVMMEAYERGKQK